MNKEFLIEWICDGFKYSSSIKSTNYFTAIIDLQELSSEEEKASFTHAEKVSIKTIEKPPSQDPYIDEVCSGRLLNAIMFLDKRHIVESTVYPYPKVSACLGLTKELSKMRNVGTKTLHEYQQLIEKYGN